MTCSRCISIPGAMDAACQKRKRISVNANGPRVRVVNAGTVGLGLRLAITIAQIAITNPIPCFGDNRNIS